MGSKVLLSRLSLSEAAPQTPLRTGQSAHINPDGYIAITGEVALLMKKQFSNPITSKWRNRTAGHRANF